MNDITEDNGRFIVLSKLKNFEQQAQSALDAIDAERVTLSGTPSNAELITVLDNVLQRQTKEIKTLRKIIRKFR